MVVNKLYPLLKADCLITPAQAIQPPTSDGLHQTQLYSLFGCRAFYILLNGLLKNDFTYAAGLFHFGALGTVVPCNRFFMLNILAKIFFELLSTYIGRQINTGFTLFGIKVGDTIYSCRCCCKKGGITAPLPLLSR